MRFAYFKYAQLTRFEDKECLPSLKQSRESPNHCRKSWPLRGTRTRQSVRKAMIFSCFRHFSWHLEKIAHDGNLLGIEQADPLLFPVVFFQFVYATLSCLGCPASRGQSLQSPFIWEVNWHLGNGRTWKNRPSFEGHPWSIGDRSLFTFFRNSFDSSPTWPRFPFFLKMKKTKQLFSPSDSSSTPGNVLLTADSEMGRWPRVTVESLIFPFLFTLFCTSPVTPSLCSVAWRARFYRFKKGPRRNLSLMTLYRTLTVLQSIPFDASLRDVILFLRYRVKAWHFLGKNSALQSLSRFAGFHFFQLFYG